MIGIATLFLSALAGAQSALASPLDFSLSSTAAELLIRDANTSSSDATLNARPRPDISKCATSNGSNPNAFTPSLYTEPLRPQVHFSPSNSFMNDPNGLVYRAESAPGANDSLWFMSYQYAYNLTVAGNQHWGLATSPDLWHWEHHAPAISPNAPGEAIFSGSSVVDYNNTSGFFNDSIPPAHRIVAIYTVNTAEKQTQDISYSLDGGFTYTRYENNPVIDRNELQFRDPKVFWDTQTQRWIMVVSLSQQFQILFYASNDLKTWQEVGRFGDAGQVGYQYECPGLLHVDVEGGELDGQKAWVLLLSINPGASSQGGSFIQYFLGSWDGSNFTATDSRTRLLEFGPDSYAAQSWDNGPNGEIKFISWASNWLYTQFAPTSPWRGAMTVARDLKLRWYPENPETSGYFLAQTPVDTAPVRGKVIRSADAQGPVGNSSFPLSGCGAFDLNITFSTEANATLTHNSIASVVVKSQSGKSSVRFGVWMTVPVQVFLDRRDGANAFADTTPFYVDRFSTIVMPDFADPNDTTSAMSINLRAIIDKSVLELYAQDGIATATSTFFFDDGEVPASVDVVLEDGSVQASNLSITELKSTWTCFVQ